MRQNVQITSMQQYIIFKWPRYQNTKNIINITRRHRRRQGRIACASKAPMHYDGARGHLIRTFVMFDVSLESIGNPWKWGEKWQSFGL